MPFCPQCRDEFEDEVEVCPDCGATLVPELPRKTIPSAVNKLRNETLVYAATAPNELVGGFWRGILEDNGIKCILKSEELRAAQYALLQNRWQRIFVLRSNQRKAKEILKPFEQSEKEAAGIQINHFTPAQRIIIATASAATILTGAG